jgi:hypothetical protein
MLPENTFFSTGICFRLALDLQPPEAEQRLFEKNPVPREGAATLELSLQGKSAFADGSI